MKKSEIIKNVTLLPIRDFYFLVASYSSFSRAWVKQMKLTKMLLYFRYFSRVVIKNDALN